MAKCVQDVIPYSGLDIILEVLDIVMQIIISLRSVTELLDHEHDLRSLSRIICCEKWTVRRIQSGSAYEQLTGEIFTM